MRSLYHPGKEDIRLTTVLYALSDPIRLRIVRNLAEGVEESCAAFGINIPKSSLSHHFRVLRESGVTHTRIEGTHRLVSLRREDLDALFPGLFDAVLRACLSHYSEPTVETKLEIVQKRV
jgi:DNA-binding transcriptional ArsR family regulator